MIKIIECPFCKATRGIYLPEMGTGESEFECEKCEKIFYVTVEYIPDVAVSKKSCHETDGKCV